MSKTKQNFYITGAEHSSGKSIIILAMMEKLAGHTGKVGFFRPVITAVGQDPLTRLITERYELDLPCEETYGCSSDVARELITANRSDEF